MLVDGALYGIFAAPFIAIPIFIYAIVVTAQMQNIWYVLISVIGLLLCTASALVFIQAKRLVDRERLQKLVDKG